MPKSRPRFFIASKKAFLVKLVSVLGFGGMVGFCVLGCDRQIKPERDIAEDTQDISADANAEVVVQPVFEVEGDTNTMTKVVATVYGPPSYLGPSEPLPDDLEAEVIDPKPEVIEPKPDEVGEPTISLAYGPRPPDSPTEPPKKQKKDSDKDKKKSDEAVPRPPDKNEREDIAVKYGVLPVYEREVISLYGVRMPDD